MSRIVRIILHFIAAFMLGMGIVACSSVVKAPQVEVTEVRLAGIDREAVQLTVLLKVTNPNSVDITLSDLRAQLSIAGQGLANAESISDKTNLMARATATVPLRVFVAFKTLPEAIKQSLIAAGDGAVPYQIRGSATAANGLLHIPFEKSGAIARRR